MVVHCVIDSPVGRLALVATETHLVGVHFLAKNATEIPAEWGEEVTSLSPVLQATQEQLEQYFAGQRWTFDLPIAFLVGTEFQRQVWQTLLHVPYGSTVSYGEVAASLGKPAAARAVGAAVGRNPVGIIVPCHRVVGAVGKLTGFGGGLSKKLILLKLEGIKMATCGDEKTPLASIRVSAAEKGE